MHGTGAYLQLLDLLPAAHQLLLQADAGFLLVPHSCLQLPTLQPCHSHTEDLFKPPLNEL